MHEPLTGSDTSTWPSDLREKCERLKANLSALGKVSVAFSGGVDSSLLLAVAREACGAENVLAITARSASLPGRELAFAKELCARLGVSHLTPLIDELADPEFQVNPPDRCYHCKKGRLTEMRRLAAAHGFEQLSDGTNRDDLGDYRPGLRATLELGVHSPLLEAGLGKEDIRRLSKQLGLPGYDRPAAACLASRIPYHTPITAESLKQVEEAEEFLMDLGFSPVRVRHHGDVARLEVAREQRARLLDLADQVGARLGALGFRYVALDVVGYHTGSLNRSLPPATPDEPGASPSGLAGSQESLEVPAQH